MTMSCNIDQVDTFTDSVQSIYHCEIETKRDVLKVLVCIGTELASDLPILYKNV